MTAIAVHVFVVKNLSFFFCVAVVDGFQFLSGFRHSSGYLAILEGTLIQVLIGLVKRTWLLLMG